MFKKVEIEELDNGYIVEAANLNSKGKVEFRRKIMLNGADLRNWVYHYFGWVESERKPLEETNENGKA